jgi:hypothetical protein
VLQVCINDTQQIGVGVRPSVGDGTSQFSLAGTHEKTHAGFDSGYQRDHNWHRDPLSEWAAGLLIFISWLVI